MPEKQAMKILERVEAIERFRGRTFPAALLEYEKTCGLHAMAICADWRRQAERIRELEAELPKCKRCGTGLSGYCHQCEGETIGEAFDILRQEQIRKGRRFRVTAVEEAPDPPSSPEGSSGGRGHV